jgi:hypothetical protein
MKRSILRGVRFLAIALLLTIRLSAALPAATVWEVRPTVGANTNGGGFVTGSAGTDWSQQNAAQYSLTNGVTNGTTLVATVSATADMVGNIAYIAGGTGSITAGWYQVVSEVLGVSITVDRSTGLTAGTGVTINIGGALSTIVQANTNATIANVIWIKATGTTTVTSALTVTLVSNGAPGNPYSFIGYSSTRGDNGQITWTTATNSINLVEFTAAFNVLFENIVFTDTAGTPGDGLLAKTSGSTQSVYVENCSFSGFNNAINGDWAVAWAFQGLYLLNSRITASTSRGLFNSGNTYVYGSMIDNNGSDGAYWDGGNSAASWWIIENSILYNNAGNGYVQANAAATGVTVISNSDFSTNGAAGILVGNALSPAAYISTSIFDANTTYGISAGASGSTIVPFVGYKNGFYNNGTAPIAPTIAPGIGTITLSASPYVSLGTNFALNNTSGGGAALKSAGFPSTIPNGGSGGPAVGALQPSVSAAGGQKGFPIVQ